MLHVRCATSSKLQYSSSYCCARCSIEHTKAQQQPLEDCVYTDRPSIGQQQQQQRSLYICDAVLVLVAAAKKEEMELLLVSSQSKQ
eukprot:10281-Heterococcus_DN1.PRE.5